MDIIVNVYRERFYYGRFKLTRIDQGLVWLYILGSSLEPTNNAFLSLKRKFVLIEQDSNYSHTYFYFEEADLDTIK